MARVQPDPAEPGRQHRRGRWQRTIGIVGGLGPFAHVEFERALLRATVEVFGPTASDQEFPPWILSSLPATPDRTAAILEAGPSPVPALLASLRSLTGADFAVVPCLTAHAFLPDVRCRSQLPILDIADATVEEIRERVGPTAQVGLLAGSGTLAADVFGNAARRLAPRIEIVTPLDLDHGGTVTQEQVVMGLIFGARAGRDDFGGGIKSGAHLDPLIGPRMRAAFRSLLDRFRAAGVTVVILGCTELPILAGNDPGAGIATVNPLAVAAHAAVLVAAGQRPLPSKKALEENHDQPASDRRSNGRAQSCAAAGLRAGRLPAPQAGVFRAGVRGLAE